jgi:hypothetical protein
MDGRKSLQNSESPYTNKVGFGGKASGLDGRPSQYRGTRQMMVEPNGGIKLSDKAELYDGGIKVSDSHAATLQRRPSQNGIRVSGGLTNSNTLGPRGQR